MGRPGRTRSQRRAAATLVSSIEWPRARGVPKNPTKTEKPNSGKNRASEENVGTQPIMQRQAGSSRRPQVIRRRMGAAAVVRPSELTLYVRGVGREQEEECGKLTKNSQ